MRVINLSARARSWWQWATCWITVQSAPLLIESFHPLQKSNNHAKSDQRFPAIITTTSTLAFPKREHGVSRPVCRAAQRKPQQKDTGGSAQGGRQTPRNTTYDLSANTVPQVSHSGHH